MRGTKLNRDMQKYYGIHAINSDKSIEEYTVMVFLPDTQLRGVECQSFYGSEVTSKVKQLEVEGEGGSRAPLLVTPVITDT